MSALETVMTARLHPSGSWYPVGSDDADHYAEKGQRVEPLTPLAPAQAEIERLKADLSEVMSACTEALTAQAALEERVRVLSEAAAEGLICAESDLHDALGGCEEHGDDPETDWSVKVFRERRDLIAAALAAHQSKEPTDV